jgi:hypothetical protein
MDDDGRTVCERSLGGDIVEVLAGVDATGELEMQPLRAELWLRRHRHSGVARITRTLAMLERAGLLWIDPGEKRRRPFLPPRVGLTEHALQILRTGGLDALRRQARGLAASGSGGIS